MIIDNQSSGVLFGVLSSVLYLLVILIQLKIRRYAKIVSAVFLFTQKAADQTSAAFINNSLFTFFSVLSQQPLQVQLQ